MSAFRKGQRVQLRWRTDDRDPPAGMVGRVTPIHWPGARGKRSEARPLVYVEWENGMQCAVLRAQLERLDP